MSRPAWILDVLAGLGAVVAAWYGSAILWGVLSMGLSLIPEVTAGSGGIGAVSAGFFEGSIPLILGIVANRLLARPARRSRGVVSRLHRGHSITLLTTAGLVALLMLALVFIVVPLSAMLAAFALIGLLFATQLLLLSALLAAFVWQRRGRRQPGASIM